MSFWAHLDEIARRGERASQMLARWKARCGTRSRQISCPICGETDTFTTRAKQDPCEECMSVLLTHAVDQEILETQPEMETFCLSSRPYQNRIPLIFARHEDQVDPEAPFYRQDDQGREVRPGDLFKHLMTELAEGLLSLFPDHSAEAEKVRHLVGGTPGWFGGGGDFQGKLPARVREAFRSIAFYVPYLAEIKEQEGFEKGSNLLTSLAAGTMTNEVFTDKITQANQRFVKRIREIEKGELHK